MPIMGSGISPALKLAKQSPRVYDEQNHHRVRQSYADHLPEDLQRPQPQKSFRRLPRCTKELGHTRTLGEISEDPTAVSFQKTLDAWFSSDKREPTDRVVFYYTGHG